MTEENIMFIVLEDNPECGILTIGDYFKKSIDLFQESFKAKEHRYCQEIIRGLKLLLVYCNSNTNLDYLSGLIDVAKAKGIIVVAISDMICEVNSDLMISCDEAIIPPMPLEEKYNFISTKLLDMLYTPQMINLSIEDLAIVVSQTKNCSMFFDQLPVEPKNMEKRSATIAELMLTFEEKMSLEENKKIGVCLFNVLGTEEMSLFDVNEVCDAIENLSMEDVEIIFGAGINNNTHEHYIGVMVLYRTFEQ